jgi:hypothetical protein
MKGVGAVLLAGPLEFFFELFCVFLVKIKQNPEKVGDNCLVLFLQMLLTVIYTYLIAQTLHDFYQVLSYGRPALVFPTFTWAFLFEAVICFPVLSIIYCVVVRRFLHLEVGEHVDYGTKQETAIPRLKVFCLKFLESQPVEMFSMTIISLYTVFTLFWLTHAEFVDGDGIDDVFLANIDQYFLGIFFVEIALKSFSSNLMYLQDTFNLFDAVIVILSVVLNFLGIIFVGLGVLRLIRVVVIILRKITGNTSKLRHQSKN